MTTINAPAVSSDVDLFADEVLRDPFSTWDSLRDLGPAVYLARHEIWVLTRYHEVRTALRDWKTWSSAEGVGLNPVLNAAWADAEICNDPPVHTDMRKLFTDRLGPRQLASVNETIDRRAAELVQQLLLRGDFDGVTDVAHDLPVNVITDLVGWPVDGRHQLLEMAAGSLDCCGPDNRRTRAALPTLERTMLYVGEVYDAGGLAPGSFGHNIALAADDGVITRDAAIGMLSGYVVAAFDTTINAIASGLWLFASHPDQWAAVCDDPELVPSAMMETIRLETPIQHLARVTTRQVDMGDDVVIPANSRVLLSYAAANRDPRKYGADAGDFRVQRRPVDHLGFGAGVHACAGQSLARLEVHAVFRALASTGRGIELTSEPERELNNMTRGFRTLPLRFVGAKADDLGTSLEPEGRH